jgi:hypothetical protein
MKLTQFEIFDRGGKQSKVSQSLLKRCSTCDSPSPRGDAPRMDGFPVKKGESRRGNPKTIGRVTRPAALFDPYLPTQPTPPTSSSTVVVAE